MKRGHLDFSLRSVTSIFSKRVLLGLVGYQNESELTLWTTYLFRLASALVNLCHPLTPAPPPFSFSLPLTSACISRGPWGNKKNSKSSVLCVSIGCQGSQNRKEKQAGKHIKYRLDQTPLFFYFNFSPFIFIFY
jgi:hypothetical protein